MNGEPTTKIEEGVYQVYNYDRPAITEKDGRAYRTYLTKEIKANAVIARELPAEAITIIESPDSTKWGDIEVKEVKGYTRTITLYVPTKPDLTE
ncbi:hypothetical protein KKD19_06130 [Patescibacteria group bacterium]|nr:hypothetical protein [Patescibacteria group bacterium]MBU4512782.1 hypothetical protein [Patescibacteria group bacterium]MCG2692529.1 hypothetical protein [Candidatus Parcubacteria bacterium]